MVCSGRGYVTIDNQVERTRVGIGQLKNRDELSAEVSSIDASAPENEGVAKKNQKEKEPHHHLSDLCQVSGTGAEECEKEF